MTVDAGRAETAAVEAPAREFSAVLPALWQLTKPGVTRLVMLTMLCGALAAPGALALERLLIGLLGTALVVGGANALNMYLEREIDLLMERTRLRPLPSGRLAPEVGLAFGVLLSVVGLSLLSFLVSPLASLLTSVALLSYVLLYTPLKRVTPLALYVGALPGAIPPLIGWAVQTGTLALPAWVMFAILFVWQVPHFLAIAIFRRDEYARAGLRVASSVHGQRATAQAVAASAAALVAVSFLPLAVGMAGLAYLLVAALVGVGFLGWSARGLRGRVDVRWARAVFFASLPYLVIVFGALVLSAP
jgi:protoheme IX farnesyltransferase